MLGTKHNQSLQLWDSSCLLLRPRSSAYRVTQGWQCCRGCSAFLPIQILPMLPRGQAGSNHSGPFWNCTCTSVGCHTSGQQFLVTNPQKRGKKIRSKEKINSTSQCYPLQPQQCLKRHSCTREPHLSITAMRKLHCHTGQTAKSPYSLCLKTSLKFQVDMKCYSNMFQLGSEYKFTNAIVSLGTSTFLQPRFINFYQNAKKIWQINQAPRQ